MKVLGISKKEDGKYIKLDDNQWYSMPENVKKFVKSSKFKEGDEVEVKSHKEGKTNILDFIKRVSEAQEEDEKDLEEKEVETSEVLKLFVKGPENKMIKVGTDTKSAKWYYVDDKLKGYLDKIEEGDEVTIRSERKNGKYYLTFLAKGRVDPPKKKDEKKVWGKTPEEQDSIKRQAIGKMTSETMIALADHLTLDNVEETIDKVYDKYRGKVYES